MVKQVNSNGDNNQVAGGDISNHYDSIIPCQRCSGTHFITKEEKEVNVSCVFCISKQRALYVEYKIWLFVYIPMIVIIATVCFLLYLYNPNIISECFSYFIHNVIPKLINFTYMVSVFAIILAIIAICFICLHIISEKFYKVARIKYPHLRG